MTREKAIIILGNIPIDGKDKCYSIAEYQEAKTMAIDALKYDIDQYCKEHFMVMVDKDVWEKAEKALKQESCEDAISRQAAIDTIESWLSCDDYNEVERHIMRAMQSVLYDLPHVTPQPTTGKWILSGGYWRCSKCKEKVLLKLNKSKGGCREYIQIKSNACPNCGAKMKSEG